MFYSAMQLFDPILYLCYLSSLFKAIQSSPSQGGASLNPEK